MEGFTMPPEWAPHERTLMAWPTRRELWEELLDDAKRDYAETARAIARFEPVLMACAPGSAQEVADLCGTDGVEPFEVPVDDSWLRDSGPIFVVSADGTRRVGVDFAFNAWGEKFHPYDADAKVAERLLDQLGDERHEVGMVLEGGSITVDGAGTLVTTEQCLLHPSRNPSMSREDIERALIDALGLDRVVWLGRGLVEDLDTDGHVDNVFAFTAPGRGVLQTFADSDDPNRANVEDNRRRLGEAGIAFTEIPILPGVERHGERAVVPPTNYYLCNGGAVVPVAGDRSDAALELIAAAHPDREVVGVAGATLAKGGGGVHCITQQVPAVSG